MNLEKEIEDEISRLESHTSILNKKVTAIDSTIFWYKLLAWVFIIGGLVVAIIGLYPKYYPENGWSLNSYGDFIGGAVSSLWSLAGLFIIFIAFLGQKQQLLYQQLEMQYSRIEVKTTRLELQGQKEQMIEQNTTLKQQRFENTFFELLSVHNDIIRSMDITSVPSNNVIASNRDCFRHFYTQLKETIVKTGKPLDKTSLDETLKLYNNLFIKYQGDLGHYFRHLYHIIKFIDSSSNEKKKQYTNFVRAQLSSYELAMLFYNCLHDNGREKFFPLIEKYSLLKNLDKKYIFNSLHLNQYSDSAYN